MTIIIFWKKLLTFEIYGASDCKFSKFTAIARDVKGCVKISNKLNFINLVLNCYFIEHGVITNYSRLVGLNIAGDEKKRAAVKVLSVYAGVKRDKRAAFFESTRKRVATESFVTSKLSNYSVRVGARWRERKREGERGKQHKHECIATRRVLQFAAVVADVIYEAIIRGAVVKLKIVPGNLATKVRIANCYFQDRETRVRSKKSKPGTVLHSLSFESIRRSLKRDEIDRAECLPSFLRAFSDGTGG